MKDWERERENGEIRLPMTMRTFEMALNPGAVLVNMQW
jgi:hypothetical protein